MLRLGSRYQHFVNGIGCACHNPALHQVAKRLDSFSRRGFLAGLGVTAASMALPTETFAQDAVNRVLLKNARIFDGKAESLTAGQVLIEGNKIASVDTTNAPAPDGATVIDCGDKVLMPGLIDAHWHTLYAAVPLNVLMTGDLGLVFTLSTAEARNTLMRGFTTVRDLGSPVFTFKQAVDSGVIPGPRIYPAGAMITTSGGHGDLRMPYEIPRDGGQLSLSERMGASAIADDAGDLKLRIREQLLQGASQIKLVGGGGVSSPRSPLDITTFSEDEIRTAVEVAADWNTYVTVHAYAPNTVQRAIRGGVACIEHAHLMDEETARMLAEKNIWLSMQPFLTNEDAAPQSGASAERVLQLFAGTPRVYEFVKKFGIKTAWGSDVLFSPALTPRQNFMLTHLSNWFTNAQVLQAATSVNADLLYLSNMRNPYPGKLGVIEKDAFADLLVIDGNPLDDIRLLEDPGKNLAVIMKDGAIHKNTL